MTVQRNTLAASLPLAILGAEIADEGAKSGNLSGATKAAKR
jgi:hypothetical protein